MTAETGSDAPEPTPSPKTGGPAGSRRRRVAAGVIAVLTVGAILAVVPRIAAGVALRIASGQINACQFGPAQWWLAWSAWLHPGDHHADLLKAACHRRLKQEEKWRVSLQEARRKGAPEHRLILEAKLNRFQSGQVEEATEAEVAAIVASGGSLSDVVPAIVEGHLAREHTATAKAILEALPHLFDEAQTDYLWGIYCCRACRFAEAETRLKRALDVRPGHELARAELADLYEQQGRLRPALEQYVELATRSGPSETAVLGLARVLRKQGRLDEARAVLAPWGSQAGPSSPLELELAQIELESGSAENAHRRLSGLRPDETIREAMAFPSIVALSLMGKGTEAQQLFDRATEVRDRSGWLAELQTRLASDPRDSAAAGQLRQLRQGTASPSLPGVPERGAELYALRCSGCHGAQGDGRGRAARYLFPRPRNFAAGGLQLASTSNGVASLDDIEKVLSRGMPGTSMPAFDTLAAADRRLLAHEVLRLWRQGIREQISRALVEAGEEPVEAEVSQAVEHSTTAGPPISLPRRWPPAGQTSAKGRQSYKALGCLKCHGEDGTGAADQSLFDDQGEPNRPRDLVNEPFKGGRERESVYVRLAVGMPGTAHPAAPGLPEDQLIELVDYVLSLAGRRQNVLTNHDRRARAAAPAYLERLRIP